MVICRAPFRVSFIGGGTDFPDYYRNYGGEVVSAAIDKYIYTTISHKFDDKIHLRYSKFECVDKLEDLKHDLVRQALKLTGITKGIEIVTISDIPAKGSGLGSSSSLAVVLLKAFYKFKGYDIPTTKLAELACNLEIDILKSPIGKQDQYACCFGSLNHIKFNQDDTVDIDNLYISANYEKIKWLEESSMLFYLGEGHSSSEILTEHKSNIPNKKDCLEAQKGLVKEFYDWLHNDSAKYIAGQLINLNWKLKKEMTPSIVDEAVEEKIKLVKQSGASGAKVCGSGKGGFLLVICDKIRQNMVRHALSDLKELDFKFSTGAEVVYAD